MSTSLASPTSSRIGSKDSTDPTSGCAVVAIASINIPSEAAMATSGQGPCDGAAPCSAQTRRSTKSRSTLLPGLDAFERLLFAEPLRRRMRVRFGGQWVVDSEDVVLLHEPDRYPVAYFPLD